MTIGRNFKCGNGCLISKKNIVNIGENVFMGRYCHLASNLTVGNYVMFGSFVSFVGGDHKFDYVEGYMKNSGRDIFKTTVIEDNVWVGHGSIILHGVTIKTGAVIAAGSVVTKDVESNSIVAGNPAKLIRLRKLK